MEADFWHQRWFEGRIGFHQAQANSILVAHWAKLGLHPETPVFVPLCGKSQDMIWLADRGHPVTGVELSRTAIEAFDSENSLHGDWSEVDGFGLYTAGAINIWQADLFSLSKKQIGELEAVFDRAALIALPLDMRKRYVKHLESLAGPNCKQLLICLEYDQSKREGPPFSVMPTEINSLYADWSPAHLGRDSVENKGLPAFDCAYMLHRK